MESTMSDVILTKTETTILTEAAGRGGSTGPARDHEAGEPRTRSARQAEPSTA